MESIIQITRGLFYSKGLNLNLKKEMSGNMGKQERVYCYRFYF